jgi:Tol biopolymer transport system component
MSVPFVPGSSHLVALLVVAATVAGGFALAAARAEAAFPGANGKVAYELDRFSPLGTESQDLYVIDAGGSNPMPLTSSGFSRDPAWSPEGTRIAFSARADSSDPWSIWVMDADGGNPRRITSGVDAFRPAWSPDGTTIAFDRRVNGFSDIFVVGVDGQGLTNVTRTPNAVEDSPAWSPDGHRIAFHLSSVEHTFGGRSPR